MFLGGTIVKAVGGIAGFEYLEDNKEAADYEAVLRSFAQGLAEFVAENKIESPKQRLALFLVMSDTYERLFHTRPYPEDVQKALWNCKDTNPHNYQNLVPQYVALFDGDKASLFELFRRITMIGAELRKTLGLKASKSLDHFSAVQKLFEDVKKTAMKGAVDALLETPAQTSVKDTYLRMRKAAQHAAINMVFQRPTYYVGSQYQLVLAALPDNLEANPFNSSETAMLFRDKNFKASSENSMAFLKPWFAQIGL